MRGRGEGGHISLAHLVMSASAVVISRGGLEGRQGAVSTCTRGVGQSTVCLSSEGCKEGM